ncbi:hypothetical protein YC2023_059139 [Brassica napus]
MSSHSAHLFDLTEPLQNWTYTPTTISAQDFGVVRRSQLASEFDGDCANELFLR